MLYYEVLVADARYHSDKPLTYASDQDIPILGLVTVPLKSSNVNAFVLSKVGKPKFATKPIVAYRGVCLPPHCIELAKWLQTYYACSLGEAVRQFTPAGPARQKQAEVLVEDALAPAIETELKLTADQSAAIDSLSNAKGTVLLHGDTGTGKTRVYLELAAKTLAKGRSVILLTPEISLTAQLAAASSKKLHSPTYVFHSQLTSSQRSKIWLTIAGSKDPVVVIGPRSALFAPIPDPGLIIIDEAHEPAYKQDRSPRYYAPRVASRLAELTKATVVLGTATPSVTDYYLAKNHNAIVRMTKSAIKSNHKLSSQIVDLKDRSNASTAPYLSKQLLSSIKTTLSNDQQVMIYLNRRGSARLILCVNCGWRLVCSRCDIPLVYHADDHIARCHSCGQTNSLPSSCPDCQASDLIYKSAGTKALADSLTKLFPGKKIARFDSDNKAGENLHELYDDLKSGKINILVGTQLLAKGLDLPKLGLVGVISADSSLSMPDFTASERTFQLIYQVAGRVGRGHGSGQVIVQTFNPDNPAIQAAINRDWAAFYNPTLAERQAFGFPPAVHLLKLVCKRNSNTAAKRAAQTLITKLSGTGLPVQIIGPTPSFRAKVGSNYYWQIAVKSKHRSHLVTLSGLVGTGWSIDLDPIDLL